MGSLGIQREDRVLLEVSVEFEKQHRLDAWHLPPTSCVDFHGKISGVGGNGVKGLGAWGYFFDHLEEQQPPQP